jgi:hypothetical protein
VCLLDNKHAATHWTVRDLLGQLGAKPQAARVVRDGRILTGMQSKCFICPLQSNRRPMGST